KGLVDGVIDKPRGEDRSEVEQRPERVGDGDAAANRDLFRPKVRAAMQLDSSGPWTSWPRHAYFQRPCRDIESPESSSRSVARHSAGALAGGQQLLLKGDRRPVDPVDPGLLPLPLPAEDPMLDLVWRQA